MGPVPTVRVCGAGLKVLDGLGSEVTMEDLLKGRERSPTGVSRFGGEST